MSRLNFEPPKEKKPTDTFSTPRHGRGHTPVLSTTLDLPSDEKDNSLNRSDISAIPLMNSPIRPTNLASRFGEAGILGGVDINTINQEIYNLPIHMHGYLEAKQEVFIPDEEKKIESEPSPYVGLPSLEKIRLQQQGFDPAFFVPENIYPPAVKMTQDEKLEFQRQRMQKSSGYQDVIRNLSHMNRMPFGPLYTLLDNDYLNRFSDPTIRPLLIDQIRQFARSHPELQDYYIKSSNIEEEAKRAEGTTWGDNKAGLTQLLSNIIRFFDNIGSLEELKLMGNYPKLTNPGAQVADIDDPKFYRKALIKETIRNLDMTRVLDHLIENYHSYRGIGKLDELKDAREAMLSARTAMEQGAMTPLEFKSLMLRYMNEILPAIAMNREGGESIENARNRMKFFWDNPHQEMTRYPKMRQGLAALHAFQHMTRKIQTEAHIHRNIPGANVIREMIKNVKEDLKEGRIDISEAFDRMNGINHINRATITRHMPVNRKFWQPAELETKEVISKMPIIGPELENKDFYKEIRDKNGLFAFPGVGIEEEKSEAGHRRVLRNIYDPNIKWKKQLAETYKIMLAEDPALRLDDEEIKKLNQGQKYNLREHFRKVLANTPSWQNLKFRGIIHTWGRPTTDSPQDQNRMTQDVITYKHLINQIGEWALQWQNNPTGHIGNMKQMLKAAKLPIKEKDAIKFYRNIIQNEPSPYPTDVQRFKTRYTPTASELRRNEQRMNQAKKHEEYVYEHAIFGQKPTQEYVEGRKIEYRNGHDTEYMVQTDEDLARMRSEVSKQEGTLYIIDLKTGRLFPIDIDKTFKGAVYVFRTKKSQEKTKHEKTGGNISHAFSPVLDSIFRDEENLIPMIHLRQGRDKIFGLYHNLINKKYSDDYRNQSRVIRGGSLWSWTKRKLNNLKNDIVSGAKSAVNQVETGTTKEWKNLKTQEQRNYRNIYQSGSNLIRNPSWSSFTNSGANVGRLLVQPAVSGAREVATLLDATDAIPGLSLAKYGAEWALPPLAMTDALTHFVKDTGYGSNDPTKYLSAITDIGDALISSEKLARPVDAAARVLNYSMKGLANALDE